jgi:formylglycine-generating enzyme required for sulfatase activity
MKETVSIARGTRAALENPNLAAHLSHASPVGSHPRDQSPEGLYDVLGSVMEYVEDRPTVWNDAVVVLSEREVMAKGHAWLLPTEWASLAMYGSHPGSDMGTSSIVGFRCAKSAAPAKEAR